MFDGFQYPSFFNIFALRCFFSNISRARNRFSADWSFFITYSAIFRWYLFIWSASGTLNRLWWAVFRWRLYPIRSRFARDLASWLDLTATTGFGVCFWFRHPSESVKSKKINFILIFLSFEFWKFLKIFIFWFFSVDLSFWNCFYTKALWNCWKWHNIHNYRVTNFWWIRFMFMVKGRLLSYTSTHRLEISLLNPIQFLCFEKFWQS